MKLTKWTIEELNGNFVDEELQELAGSVFDEPMGSERTFSDAQVVKAASKVQKDGREWAKSVIATEGTDHPEGTWLGTVYALLPSGRYGSCAIDIIFLEGVDHEADKAGVSISGGDDEPDNLYIWS